MAMVMERLLPGDHHRLHRQTAATVSAMASSAHLQERMVGLGAMLSSLLGVLAVVGGVLVVTGLVLVVALRARRAPAGDRGSREREALERTGLSTVLTAAGFSVARPGLFVRGRVEVHALVAGEQPDVESLDVRALGVQGRPLALEQDFVAHAKRGPDGAVRVQAHVEAREGKGTVRRDAAAAEKDRLAAVVNARVETLEAISWTALDVFNHRVPRVHVYLRPASGPAGGEQVEQAARLVVEIADDLTGRTPDA